MTLSTQNNHKHDAQVNIPHSTEKNVDSSKEKAKNNGLSKKAAASKAVSEVDAIQTKSSLQSSVSENNFDTKLKNNARVEGKSSKHHLTSSLPAKIPECCKARDPTPGFQKMHFTKDRCGARTRKGLRVTPRSDPGSSKIDGQWKIKTSISD